MRPHAHALLMLPAQLPEVAVEQVAVDLRRHVRRELDRVLRIHAFHGAEPLGEGDDVAGLLLVGEGGRVGAGGVLDQVVEGGALLVLQLARDHVAPPLPDGGRVREAGAAEEVLAEGCEVDVGQDGDVGDFGGLDFEGHCLEYFCLAIE